MKRTLVALAVWTAPALGLCGHFWTNGLDSHGHAGTYIYEGALFNNECVIAVRDFFRKRYGLTIPYLGTNGGAYLLASMQIEGMVKLAPFVALQEHDMVVFAPSGSNRSGHVAVVARVLGGRSCIIVESNVVPPFGHQGGARQVTLDKGVMAVFRPVTQNISLAPIRPWNPAYGPVSYSGHFQDIGDFSTVANGEILGTIGIGKRMEGIRILAPGRNIAYRVHVQNIGWMPWETNGSYAGTVGQGLRVEAIEIDADHGDVFYKVHVQDHGWMQTRANGQTAGTVGHSLRIEAMVVYVKD